MVSDHCAAALKRLSFNHVRLSTEVVIGFIDPPYQVNESDGSVNLTIGVLTGILQRQVVLSLSTSDDTALSKL